MTQTSKPKPQPPRQGDDLILYRLDKVESAVREVGSKVDRQDNIKRSDLKEFQETIVTRFLDMSANLQKQIDTKANSTELADLKKLVYSAFGFLSSIITALVIAYLTTKG